MTWLAFKLLMGDWFKAAGNILAWCTENWKLLLALVIAAVLAWQFYAIDAERDAAVKALNNYVAENAQAARERAIENAQKEADAKDALSDLKLEHRTEMLKLMEIYDDKRKDEVTKVKKTERANYDQRIADFRNRLRNELESKTTDGLPELASLPERSTEGGGECHTAFARLKDQYETLEAACTVTTLDYNRCAGWAEANCQIFGCR